MTKQDLIDNIRNKRSFLCVGLDTDVKKIPAHLQDMDDPIFAFNKAIIDATAASCVAYKPNLAFYENMGPYGLSSLLKTVQYIRENYPKQLIIADAKRGDIGNTGEMYASSLFEHFKVDAATVSPYMGSDSVKPFLRYPGCWAVLLALTSNEGAKDFQLMQDADGEYLFERVLRISQTWEDADRMMYVVGATKADMLKRVRKIVPESFLLIPGIGAQSGSLDDVIENGMTDSCGLLINASRSIIYADNSEYYALTAATEAENMRRQMEAALIKRGIL